MGNKLIQAGPYLQSITPTESVFNYQDVPKEALKNFSLENAYEINEQMEEKDDIKDEETCEDTSPWSQVSLESTRNLEFSILQMIGQLTNSKQSEEIDKSAISSLLSKSLSAISHWSLQAQLLELKKETAFEAKMSAEINLIWKEVSFLKSVCKDTINSEQHDGYNDTIKQIKDTLGSSQKRVSSPSFF